MTSVATSLTPPKLGKTGGRQEMTTSAQFVTPPKYAKSSGIGPAKVITWIKNGELRAFNAATSVNGRPRYLIPLEAIVEFEERRSARQPAKPTRRKRKKQDSDYVQYF